MCIRDSAGRVESQLGEQHRGAALLLIDERRERRGITVRVGHHQRRTVFDEHLGVLGLMVTGRSCLLYTSCSRKK